MRGGFSEAHPRASITLEDCDFYHSVELPQGRQEGVWDLVSRFDDYVAHEALGGRSLLDVGTASGFLTFEAEKRGAVVTSLEAASSDSWHQLPIRGIPFVDDHAAWRIAADMALERWKNSYWLCHRELGSRARCFYGDLHDLSPAFGSFDVVLIGQVLIHLPDGIAALRAAASVCRDRIIIVEGSFRDDAPVAALSGRADMPEIAYAWYQYSHGWYREILAMLGFRTVSISADMYRCNQADHASEIELATVVGRRTGAA
jgi:hypothetical protein